MKRPFSPLVWLCAAGTLLLAALVLLDPNGVYSGYVDALDESQPVIAAVFTAAQDGVYPWTAPSAREAKPAPSFRPLTGTVTDDEVRSSVGNDEPFPDAGAVAAPEPVPPAEMQPLEPAEPLDTAEEPEGDGFIPVDESWFDDALFIGDSHTEGFCDYAGLNNATYYFKRGVDVWCVMDKAFVDGKMTIPQALTQRRFGKIYIMLGINEIMVGSTESFAAQYAEVVDQLRILQPDALIYIQSIFHTTKAKSDSSVYNNDTINARNAAIAGIADGKQVFYIDCNVVFDDETGALTPSYSGDGVHVKAPYYTLWRDHLFQFGRNVDGSAPPVPGGGAAAAPRIIAPLGAVTELDAVSAG
ncbi:MAG: hypothetical protein E7474_14330 [Ruminococcaceae bacterium]|nr:hypothetical protein [Oscillospiraceae bacterium]